MVPLTQVNGKINMRTESRTHGAVLRRTLGCAGCGTEKPAQSSQEPRAWCHIRESSPHTWSVSCTPALARLQLFPLKSSKSFGDEGWMLAILRTPLLFISCVFWNQLPRYPAWWESAPASFRQTAAWLKWKCYFPENAPRTAPAISWLLTWPENKSISRSKSICFPSFSSSLTFNYAIQSETIAPQPQQYPDLQVWATMSTGYVEIRQRTAIISLILQDSTPRSQLLATFFCPFPD